MVNKMGMATLCANKADAQQEAADAQSLWPDMGPHRAVQLVEAAQQESFDHGPQATSIEEAARDVGKWLNERPNRPLDLRHVAMLCAHAQPAPAAVAGPSSNLRKRCAEILAWRKTGVLPGEALRTLAHDKYGDEYDAIQRAERDTETEALNFVIAAPTTQPAPQQEAQEPVAWYVTGCGRLLDEDEAKAEARHIGGTARAIPVYTAPQPSPAAQGDALDAARYRYLRDGDWRENDKLEPIIRLQLNSLWDAAIDAARAAQEGKSHDN